MKHRRVLWRVLVAGAARMQLIRDRITQAQRAKVHNSNARRIQRVVCRVMYLRRRAKMSPVQLRCRVILLALAFLGSVVVQLRRKRAAGTCLLGVLRRVQKSPAKQLVRRYQTRVKAVQRFLRGHRRITVDRLLGLLLMWDQMESSLTKRVDAKRVQLGELVVNNRGLKFPRPPTLEEIRSSVARQIVIEQQQSPQTSPRKRPSRPILRPTLAASATLSMSASARSASGRARRERGGGGPLVPPLSASLGPAGGFGRHGATTMKPAISTLGSASPPSRSRESKDNQGSLALIVESTTSAPVVIGFASQGTPIEIRVALLRSYLAARRSEHLRKMALDATVAGRAGPGGITASDMLCLMNLPRAAGSKVLPRIFGRTDEPKRLVQHPLSLFRAARRDMRVLIEEGLRRAAVQARIEFQRLYMSAKLGISTAIAPRPEVVCMLDEDAVSVGGVHAPVHDELATVKARESLAARHRWNEYDPAWTVEDALARRLGLGRAGSKSLQEHGRPHHLDVEELRHRHQTSLAEPMSAGVVAVLDTLVSECRAGASRPGTSMLGGSRSRFASLASPQTALSTPGRPSRPPSRSGPNGTPDRVRPRLGDWLGSHHAEDRRESKDPSPCSTPVLATATGADRGESPAPPSTGSSLPRIGMRRVPRTPEGRPGFMAGLSPPSADRAGIASHPELRTSFSSPSSGWASPPCMGPASMGQMRLRRTMHTTIGFDFSPFAGASPLRPAMPSRPGSAMHSRPGSSTKVGGSSRGLMRSMVADVPGFAPDTSPVVLAARPTS